MIQELKNLYLSAVLYLYKMNYYPTLIAKGVAYVEVSGDLIGDEAGNKLRDTVDHVLKHSKVKTLILNLGAALQIDSYSIAQLMVAKRELEEIRGKLQFHSVTESVRETFDLIMFSRVLETVDIEWPTIKK